LHLQLLQKRDVEAWLTLSRSAKSSTLIFPSLSKKLTMISRRSSIVNGGLGCGFFAARRIVLIASRVREDIALFCAVNFTLPQV
jgi:hypothetical protein